jgi:gamma-glutamyltranspeptidase/glutathione hydrolase
MPTVDGVHLISEAERLAYADRDAYVADTDFVPLPGGSPAALLDPAYLASRAALIQIDHSMGTAPAGEFGSPAGIDATPEHGTSQVTIVDAAGNALAMTSSVESTFGSFHMAAGVVLNNQLTDFSAQPSDPTGAPIANRVAGGKRPRSSMAPTLVFRTAADGTPGDFVMATGSPGGATIIQYVVKTLVGVLDWGLDAQASAALVNFGAANDPSTNLGSEHPDFAAQSGPLITGLRARGHTLFIAPQFSGIATVVRLPAGGAVVLEGGADPRREGLALGDLLSTGAPAH